MGASASVQELPDELSREEVKALGGVEFSEEWFAKHRVDSPRRETCVRKKSVLAEARTRGLDDFRVLLLRNLNSFLRVKRGLDEKWAGMEGWSWSSTKSPT